MGVRGWEWEEAERKESNQYLPERTLHSEWGKGRVSESAKEVRKKGAQQAESRLGEIDQRAAWIFFFFHFAQRSAEACRGAEFSQEAAEG